jgi:Tol biopolymer transport system component/DNA-binding winged helix-turn-helix (wHTH) protein
MNIDCENSEQALIYNFGSYALDTRHRIVRHGDRILDLTPKQFQTLLVLVENHDRIMSKEELLESIWPEHFVEESNVIQNICVLRKQLGENVQGQKFIETFPRRGYKFSERVAVVREPHSGAISPTEGLSQQCAPIVLTESRAELDSLPWLARRFWNPKLLFLVVPLFLLAIVAALVPLLRRSSRPTGQELPATGTSGPRSQLRTLSRMDGAQLEPSWSRDEKQIAFVYISPDDSGSAIYIQSAQQSGPRRVVAGAGRYSSPVWSPDGTSIAYLRIQPTKTEIEVFNFSDQSERALASLFPHRYQLNYRHLDWSPDGRFLVVDDKSTEADPLSLYLISVRSGNKIRLTYPNMDIIGDVAPRFSPDASQIAFIRLKYRLQNDVFVVPVIGGEQRRLTTTSSRLADVDWSSNHSLIYSGESSGEFHFWRVGLLPSVSQSEIDSSIATEMPPDFSISRHSGQMVLSAYEPDLNIWSVNLSKPHPTSVDWARIVQTPAQDLSPSISPDGNKIAYRSNVSGRMQLWVCNADGSGAFMVNTGNVIPEVDSWSPDSKSIVFSSSGGLFQVDASRSPRLRRIESQPVSHPSFSIDGKWIFARKNYFVFRLPASGGALEQLSDQGGAPIVQSQDGRYLYFGHDRMNATVTRLDLTTGKQEVILRSLIPGYRASWALTRKGIVFLTELRGRPIIAFYDFATGKQSEITEFRGALPSFSTSAFSVSPDGKRLLVVRADPAFANLQVTSF